MTEPRISDETLEQLISLYETHRDVLTDEERLALDLRDARAALAEAQREIERLKAEARALPQVECACHPGVRWPTSEWGEPCRLTAAEQHVAALRGALEQWVDERERLSGSPGAPLTSRAIRATAILADTAAGSAAWLAAHDAEKDARIAALVTALRTIADRDPLLDANEEAFDGPAARRMQSIASLALANLPAAAAAYTADVRRAAFKAAVRWIMEDEHRDHHTVTTYLEGITDAEIARALAAQPEGK